MLAITLLAFTACSDDEIKTKGQLMFSEIETAVASGWFVQDTSPNYDGNENEYFRNQLAFFGKGLKATKSSGGYAISGSGDMLELYINNAEQGLKTGTYTWQDEENEQPFDLWYGLYTQNANTEDEATYRLTEGTLTVSKSGDAYKISFEGIAYFEFDEVKQAGLPPVDIALEFKGPLKKAKFDF